MDRQLTGDEIGLGRKDITILADPHDFAGVFQLAQSLANVHALTPLCPEPLRDFISIERPIIGGADQSQNLFSNCAAVFAHIDDTILEDVDLKANHENNYYRYVRGGGGGRVCRGRRENENYELSLSGRRNDSGEIQ